MENNNTTIKFVSYESSEWCLCRGKLQVIINGELVTFSEDYFLEEIPQERKYTSFWVSGGSCSSDDSEEGAVTAPWVLMKDQLPEEYRELGQALIDMFNEHVEWGCCGGCI